MYARSFFVAGFVALLGGSSAAPTSTSNTTIITDYLHNDALLSQTTSEITAVLAKLDDVVLAATPTSVADVTSVLKSVFAATPTALLQNVVELALNGLRPESLTDVFNAYSSGVNSENNNNLMEPESIVYPTKDNGNDAVYDISEEKLRGAIYIPDNFTYGRKPPVLLVPGTGTKGGFAYGGNLAKLLPQEDYADPVWLNIPDWLLADVQQNAEFVAYAINYISGITFQNVSVIAWSQGNLATQWAFTYWPSTREVVSDYIAISPDYHGTVLVYAICPLRLPCSPSVIQQKYDSKFIGHLRKAGGDSAYVPTTVVYTATDDIVQPMQGTNASAFLNDERNVGVLIVEMQTSCPPLSTGLVGTHESVLYSSVLSTLIKDALTHDGPADISRISNFNEACSKIAADGLSLDDIIATTISIPLAVVAVQLYPGKVVHEPAIKAYAA